MTKPSDKREFTVNPTNANIPPLLIGLMGPPGGGKTKSALRIADGMAKVRGGKPLLIDTEAGRALRYHKSRPGGTHDFDYIQFTPPFIPAHFMDAIKQGVEMKAACIIVDSMSDEHEGEGGVLDWHDREVPNMGGNEWAAWSKPKASRRVLISGIQQIRIPVILTFRAREKTTTKKENKGGRVRDVPVNIGFMPIAPAEIVHTLDLVGLIPPRANGVPIWNSPKEGEEFMLKLPEFLSPLIEKGAPLDERLGEALALWQKGDGDAATMKATAHSNPDEKRKMTPEEMVDAYVAAVGKIETLDELRDYQTDDRRAAWIAKVKTQRPDLHDRITSANSQQYSKLMAAAGADDDKQEVDQPDAEPGQSESDLQYDDDRDTDGGLFGGAP